MTPGTTLDRLLGRIPISPPPPRDLIILHYRSVTNEQWLILFTPGQSLDAFQAAMDWAIDLELNFTLDDASRVNDAITTAVRGRKFQDEMDTEQRRQEGQ